MEQTAIVPKFVCLARRLRCPMLRGIAIGLLAIGSTTDAGRNLLLICVDDLRPELGCYGVDRIHSPHIDRLASEGVVFDRHYVQAPTCGASRSAFLTGRYGPSGNDALFRRAERLQHGDAELQPSLPGWLRRNGYRTVSVGKVSHHPGGLGGPDWDDPAVVEMPGAWDRSLVPTGAWQTPRGWMHGLADGQVRKTDAKMPVMQAVSGPANRYPDGVAVEAAIEQLDRLAGNSELPFCLAVGILRPHLPFGCPRRYLDIYQGVDFTIAESMTRPSHRSTWHGSKELLRYDRGGRDPRTDAAYAAELRRHYAACVSFADDQVGKLVDRLDALEIADETLVVLWGDHGWHLGEHDVWGKHTLFDVSLRAPLIVRVPGDQTARQVPDVVESIDVFPTVLDLLGVEVPAFLHGRSLRSLCEGEPMPPKAALSYYKEAASLRNTRYRLVAHDDGYQELYDLASSYSKKNYASELPAVAAEMAAELADRLALLDSGHAPPVKPPND